MKNLVLVLLRVYFRALSFVLPQIASQKAKNIFFTPKKHASKRWEVSATQEAQSIMLDQEIHCLMWGKEDGDPILLVHGWEGRASQMSVFIPYLAKHYKLIAINAPAHGDSLGVRSHPGKFIKAIFIAQKHFGPFHAIIGHSLGGGSAVYASLEGLNVRKVVSIAGPANFLSVVKAFGNFVGLRGRAFQEFVTGVSLEVELSDTKVNLASRVGELEQPLLIIHDLEDIEIPYIEAYKYKKNIKHGQFEKTAGFGHRKIMQSNQVLQKVTDFVTSD